MPIGEIAREFNAEFSNRLGGSIEKIAFQDSIPIPTPLRIGGKRPAVKTYAWSNDAEFDKIEGARVIDVIARTCTKSDLSVQRQGKHFLLSVWRMNISRRDRHTLLSS
jgi:hypothetical protein